MPQRSDFATRQKYGLTCGAILYKSNIMEILGLILFYLSTWVCCFIFVFQIPDAWKRRDKIFALIGYTILFTALGAGHFLLEDAHYKKGQIDYYKHGFKYIPVVHRCDSIITDTVYIEK